MARRAYVDPSVLDDAISGQPFMLDADTAHRFVKVLRLSSGAPVELFDGTGRVVSGKLELGERASLSDVSVEINKVSGPKIVIAQALAKMDKLEEVVQRATELGAQKIIFFDAERSVVHFKDKAAPKMERLARIAQDAARQSERVDVPLLVGPSSFQEVLDACGVFEGIKIVGDPYAQSALSQLLVDEPAKARKGVLLVIGPEGGMSLDEVSALGAHGVVSAKWGPHVLRTETAALAALAVIQASLKNA